MDPTELLAAVNLLAQEMEGEPDDLHEVHLRLLEILSEIKATGMPLPDDLVELEKRLTADVEGVPERDES
jgi:hypothetical protein